MANTLLQRRIFKQNLPANGIPSGIQGLAVWLDSQDLSSLTIDGNGRVSRWRDKSGRNFHFAQTDALAMPLWGENDGKSSVTFDGSNDTMSNALTHGIVDITVVAAMQYTTFSGTPNTRPFWGLGSPGAARFEFVDFGATYLSNTWGYRSPFFDTASGVNLDALRNLYSATIGKSGATLTGNVWLNASQIVTNFTGSSATTNFGPGMRLARGSLETYLYSAVRIHELCVYSRVLPDSERTIVEDYLKAKWGTV